MSTEPRRATSAGAVDAELTAFLRDLRTRTAGVSRATPLPTEPLAGLRELDETADLPARFTAAASHGSDE